MAEAQVIQVILHEFREQRKDIQHIRTDIGEMKVSVRLLTSEQAALTERLKKLEEAASKGFSLDWKTLLKIVSVLGVVTVGATHGLPEGAWRALIGLLGG